MRSSSAVMQRIAAAVFLVMLLAISSVSVLASHTAAHRADQCLRLGDAKQSKRIASNVITSESTNPPGAITKFAIEDLITEADIERAKDEMYSFLKWKLGGPAAICAQYITGDYGHFRRAYADEGAAMLLGLISFSQQEPEIVIPERLMELIRKGVQTVTAAAITAFLNTELGVPSPVATVLGNLIAAQLVKVIPEEVRTFIPKSFDIDNRLVDAAITAKRAANSPSAEPLALSSLNPNSGPPGTAVTVNGSGFRKGLIKIPLALLPPLLEGSEVLFDGSAVRTSYVSQTKLQFTVPSDATCGSHNVQVRNSSNVLSNMVTFTVAAPCSGGVSNAPPSAGFSYDPMAPATSQEVQFLDESTDPDGDVDIVSWSWDFGDGMTSTEPDPKHIFVTAGTFTVKLVVNDTAGQQGTAHMSVTVASGGTPPPPPSGGSSLQSFDVNNNNLIDDSEFFAIIDAWIAGQIDNALFFQAVDLWVSQSPISSSSVNSRTRSIVLSASFTGNTLTFAAYGEGIRSLGIEIYDLNGRRIFTEQAHGTQLTWRLTTQTHQPVANGVYLSTVTLRGLHGELISRQVKKLVVMR